MKNRSEVNLMSPLTWAYIGDCVYELYIREHLVQTTNLKPHKLHIEAIKHVKAAAQAKVLKELEDFLTDEEKVKLLASDGMLVKRPLIVEDGRILVGFKEKEWVF